MLPVFPLRKSVRLPTETLTLNLYEERYLAMSTYILDQEERLFGALYGSDKPQMVHLGKGPIVPMYSDGDVGVIFKVYENMEAMIPTAEQGYKRRRMRLKAGGIGRFRITKILHPGYGEALPYILAQTERIVDIPEDIEDLKKEFDGVLDPSAVQFQGNLAAYKALSGDIECNESEIYSFAVAAKLSAFLSPEEITGLLWTRSSRHRLELLRPMLRQRLWSFKRFFGLI
jgi:Lon protease-like protein